MHVFKRSLALRTKVYILSACCIILAQVSCTDIQRNESHKEIKNESIKAGKALAEIYCKSCHAFPDPSLLNASTWEETVLPAMGPRLGIFEFNYRRYPSNRSDIHLSHTYYPEKPLISLEQWKHITDYYLATAPDSLELPSPAKINNQLPFFEVQSPSFTYENPTSGYTKIDTTVLPHRLIISDLLTKKIFTFNKNLEVTDSLDDFGPVVNLDFQRGKILACNIGILNPNNGKFGKASFIGHNKNGRLQKDTATVMSKLARPVQITSSDLNKDGITDYAVCEFGYLAGSFSWLEGTVADTFIRHILSPLPGAIKAYINDANHDGLPDIWVLMAHGEEGIYLYTNKGNGKFEQQEVLRFPPCYGSSYFELADFNKDGNLDILYTCGDNADYSPILKPYHGVYIYLNEGNNHYKEKYFFHINGCYKAIAADYDKDGDLDIAAISFFADYQKNPEEGFVYLDNKGGFKFDSFTLPQLKSGRWISMDAGDIDGDGKTDLVLGNCSLAPGFIKSLTDWKHGPPFLLLKNITK